MNRLPQQPALVPGIRYYKCDDQQNPIPCHSMIEYAEWYEGSQEIRRVGLDEFNGVTISTVFLGVPHLGPDDEPFEGTYLYETMVFADDATLMDVLSSSSEDLRSIFGQFFDWNDAQRRYRTADEARAGHAEMVEVVTRVLAARN